MYLHSSLNSYKNLRYVYFHFFNQYHMIIACILYIYINETAKEKNVAATNNAFKMANETKFV